MPVCPRCGRNFSGFSFGSKPATECSDCRKSVASAIFSPERVPVVKTPQFRPLVTQILVGLNVLVYVAMGLSGVSWTDPSIQHAVRWGADFGPLTFSGEWWRLLTSMFVHFGIIHIAFNMWCLWDLGRALEFYMGRKAFALTYLLSGFAASMVSVAWNPWRVSAGASGAIFGVAGAFVSYLAFKKTPIEYALVRQKLKSLAFFIFYNLLYGIRGGVDNSAHLGGLLAGLLLGALIPPLLKSVATAGAVAEVIPTQPLGAPADRESRADQIIWQIGLGGAIVLLVAAVWIHKANLPAAHYGKAVKLVESGHMDGGISEMQQALTLDPQIVIANALLGEWQLEQSNPAAAIPVLERTLLLAPNAYDIEHNLALAYLGSGQAPAAVEEINRALQYETQYQKTDAWRAQCILAFSAGQLGDSRRASDNLRLVLQAQPDFQEAKDALTNLETNSGRDAPPAIPYSKLALKSELWPLYP
jgi:membrane associated rhomboid family serine protease/Flp pilus assembly protein TadD